jgi:ketosteroid isomerase-like protein
MSDDADTIRRIFEQELPAHIRAGDADGYISLWGGDDCLWCPQDSPDVFGRAAIHQAVADLLASVEIDPTFVADEAHAYDAHGYVLGTTSEKMRPRDGSPPSVLYTRELWQFVKDDGQWKIRCMVFNHKPAPPAA